MNTRPLEIVKHIDDTAAEMAMLTRNGFSDDEIISLLWLRQWYQTGGSDRVEVVRHLEFLKLMVMNGKLES